MPKPDLRPYSPNAAFGRALLTVALGWLAIATVVFLGSVLWRIL